MDIIRKNMEYNHGTPLPFEVIKQNREQATLEMSEGNVGLYKLLNTCIDINLPTLSCCGDVQPMIAFEYNDQTKEVLCSLWAYIESLYEQNNLMCSIRLCHYEMADRCLIVKIKEKLDASCIFELINQFIKNPQYISDYTLYEEFDAILEKLSETFEASDIGDGHSHNDIYKYIIYTDKQKNILRSTPKGLKDDTTYIAGYGFKRGSHYYGLKNESEVKELMYALYDGWHMKTKESPELENLIYKLEKIKDKR